MKRAILSYFHFFTSTKSSLNVNITNLFKNHGRSVLQFRNFQSTSVASSQIKDSEVVEVIYKAPQVKMVKRMRLSTLSIGATAIIAQPFVISKLLTTQSPFILYLVEGGTSLLLILPILFHFFTRGYVYEIMYDDIKKTYIAKLNNFFLRPYYLTFQIEDVKPAESTFTSFYVKGKPLIVFEESFVDVSHFIKMKGFDKPLDVKLGTLSKPELPKSK